MSRLHLFVYLCTNLLVVFVHGGIIYKVCNQAQSAQLDQAIQDVVEMAQNAKDRLSDSPMLSQTSALWDVLYFPADLSTVKQIFNEIIAVKQTTLELSIYCNEDHIKAGPGSSATALWQDTDFHRDTPPFAAINLPISQGPADMAKVPRPKPGASSSYVIHGWSSGTVNLGNQVHIMIDPKAMGASTPAYERRPLKDIVLNGLDPVYGGSLTAIRPLEVTMLHEFAHAVSGLRRPDQGSMLVNDGPNKDSYGWEKCERLRRAPGLTSTFAPKFTADSYAQLATGLFVQVKNQPTFWSKGRVDLTTLRPSPNP